MDSTLPDQITDRFRWVHRPDRLAGAPGEFVLYWMHHALRAHENPALDAAICLARQNGLPLVIYHGISEDYPYASDRLHAFMLQGHRDVQRELRDRGLQSFFHMQRQGCRGPYLKNLTRGAAVMVSEEMPVQPVVGWMERLAATCSTPLATVDCSCLAPVTQSTKAFECSDQFRDFARPIQMAEIQRPHLEQSIDFEQIDAERLCHQFDLKPLCLQDTDLAKLIGQCRIDHSIAPVAETAGGSRAGYARWEQFRDSKLARYDEHRDDALSPEGASRMSAYLHYGMVSPFRIAREANERKAVGFVDELLTHREMAFHFCFHHRDIIDTMEAIPDWARTTLREHASDERGDECSWETLSRGKCGRGFWDTAQRSLRKHGELHRSIRMSWGKSLLPWTCSPERALQLVIDLNHRFSLDGRNPASYGGLLWCFGQFDQPNHSSNPVWGKVQPHCSQSNPSEVDFAILEKWIDRPIADQLPRVAVVGAGMAGLVAARTLMDHGIDVTVFDSSAGPGGRMSVANARVDGGSSPLMFDHGTQYFHARDAGFCRLVNSWMDDGLAQPWHGRFVTIDAKGQVAKESRLKPRYVGTPNMNSIARHIASDLTIEFNSPVTETIREEGQWRVITSKGQYAQRFDLVVLACPPKQAAKLIGDQSTLADQVQSVRMRSCWALMLADEVLSKIPFDAAKVDHPAISWIARNDRKPGRRAVPSWVVHASADWTEQHLEDDSLSVQESLWKAFESLVDIKLDQPRYAQTYLWRDAVADNPLECESLFDTTASLGVCGDWCSGKRLESAFLSGTAVAGSILRHYTIDRRSSHDYLKLASAK